MKKPLILLLTLMTAAALTGCAGGKSADSSTPESASGLQTATETGETTIAAFAEPETTSGGTIHAQTVVTDMTPEDVTIRVGSLKGPTSMGLVSLMDLSKKGQAANQYEFTMVTAADELVARIASGDMDIALIPANVASILYHKTQGGISVIDINTLGVLDVVSSDDSIRSLTDLKGKIIYMTGKGTTPDYVFHYLLSENGLTESDITLEFKSEPAEVAAILKEQPGAVGVLPQPFVTAVCAQNENLKIVLDLTREWQAVQKSGGSQLVTGVTIVRNDFLKEYPDALALFLSEHQASARYTSTNPDETSELIAALGIIEKAPIAKKALPYCNITCITGEEMKTALSGYLQVLAGQDPRSVGGKLPEDDFYFIPQA